MQLQIRHRAEIALRSLQKVERNKIERSLNELLASDRSSLNSNPKFRLVAAGFSGKKLAVYRGSTKLRLVLSFEDDTCILEDVVDHDRLDQLARRGEQE